MTNKPEHTPLPWEVRKSPIGDDCFVQAKRMKPEHPYDIEVLGDDTNEELYPYEQKEQDAAFIVRACNSHYDLIEVLEKILDEPFTNPSTVKRARNIIERARGEA